MCLDDKFKQLLAEDGLKVIETPTNGNCLFAAIASQLSYLGQHCSHEDVRHDIIQFIHGIVYNQEQVSTLTVFARVSH